MINIDADRLLTIEASAGEVYAISYSSPRYADIHNQTSGDLNIDINGEFKEDGAVKHYIIIPSGGVYNGFKLGTDKLYIRTESNGNVSVVHRGAR